MGIKQPNGSAIKHIYYRIFLLFFLVSTSVIKSEAQESIVHSTEYVSYQEALDLYDKEKYGSAQHKFADAMKVINNPSSEIFKDAMYYHAICAIELFHADAEALLLAFIHQYPESIHLKQAYFNLGKFVFRNRKYDDAIVYFNKIYAADVDKDAQSEYYFKKGYSYFMEEDYDNAVKNFYEIVDTDNPYTATARYYYGHISYLNGNYETAAQNFRKIEKDPLFEKVVPYYLTQIMYLQGKYRQLLEYAPPLIENINADRAAEIKRLIGDAYYKTDQFEKALPYLEDYIVGNPRSRYEDKYQLGYTYYKTGNCKNAIDWMKESIGDNDTINQSAYYTLGECYIKEGDKNQARTAFRNSTEIKIDDNLREDALFNYAKLAYELSFHPYDDAILAFEEFINTYPKSKKVEDAYEYLVAVYYTTKNYKAALKSMARIKDKSFKLKEAEQRIAYYRGVELFNDGLFQEALEMFDHSSKYQIDRSITANNVYWKGEASYRINDYANALGYFTEFLQLPAAPSLNFYNVAYYNTAYTYFELKQYNEAIYWFRNYLSKNATQKSKLRNDAYLRLGDAYFITKNYPSAIENYEAARKIGLTEMSYAAYQSAMANGLTANNKRKSDLLKHLIDTYNNSIYVDDALSELAKTQLMQNEQDAALANYQRIINEYPNSSYMSEALLKRGLIYYNKNQDDLALASFDKVIKDHGSSKDAKEALDRIRKIYIDKGDMTAFEKYISGVPFADISTSKLDSTSYEIAQNSYLSGNCQTATRNLTNYLTKYTNGIFTLDAHFYRADCEYKNKLYNEALLDYKFVLDKPKNKFTEDALYTTAFIHRDMDDTLKAISTFKTLESIAEKPNSKFEAQYNLMQLYFGKKDFDEAFTYSEKVLKTDKLDSKLMEEVKLIQAKINFSRENYDAAIDTYKEVGKFANKRGAEAKFMLARIYYLKGEYKPCEETIYKLVNQVPSYPYWIAKGFILLADNFLAQKDVFNAKVTLQSVIDNADNEELVEVAKEKLNSIIKSEKEQQNKNANQAPEIDLLNNDSKDGKLFNEQSPE